MSNDDCPPLTPPEQAAEADLEKRVLKTWRRWRSVRAYYYHALGESSTPIRTVLRWERIRAEE